MESRMSNLAARELHLARKLKDDLEAYARACLVIRGKDKVARPLLSRARHHAVRRLAQTGDRSNEAGSRLYRRRRRRGWRL